MDDAAIIAERRPLFVTGDESTEAALRKLSTAAGTEAWCAADARTARRYWNQASVVVIAADAVSDCSTARLPQRDEVILLTGPRLSYDRAWPLALSMGAAQVASLPEAAAWLAGRLAPRSPSPRRAGVVAVTGARGGAGASVLATAVAVTAAAGGRSTLLVDADARGGGLDLLLGWENREGLRWGDLAATSGPFDPGRLRRGLPCEAELSLLSFARERGTPPRPATVAAVLDAASRSHELVVVDVPRHGEPWLLDAVAGSDLLTVLVPGEIRAVAAARQVIAGYAGHCDRVRLVVASPSPGRLSTADIVRAVGVPLVAELRADPRARLAAETGALASRARHGALSTAAMALLATLDTGSTAPQQTPEPAGASR